MVAITSSLKKIASAAERIAHTRVKGSDTARAVVKDVGAKIEKVKLDRKAKKAAKADQKYQDFEREHLSESAEADRTLRKSKEDLADAKRERREFAREQRKGRKNPYAMFSSSRSTRDPLDAIVGSRKAVTGKAKHRAADYSLGGSNALNLGSGGKKKKKSRLF